MNALGKVSAAVGLLGLCAACGGEDIAAQQQAMRSPERIQQKTAELIAPDNPAAVTVSDIRLAKHPRGKSLIVEWLAQGPDGRYRCNADKRVDFPVCDPVGGS
jgi:hypothetical protein